MVWCRGSTPGCQIRRRTSLFVTLGLPKKLPTLNCGVRSWFTARDCRYVALTYLLSDSAVRDQRTRPNGEAYILGRYAYSPTHVSTPVANLTFSFRSGMHDAGYLTSIRPLALENMLDRLTFLDISTIFLDPYKEMGVNIVKLPEGVFRSTPIPPRRHITHRGSTQSLQSKASNVSLKSMTSTSSIKEAPFSPTREPMIRSGSPQPPTTPRKSRGPSKMRHVTSSSSLTGSMIVPKTPTQQSADFSQAVRLRRGTFSRTNLVPIGELYSSPEETSSSSSLGNLSISSVDDEEEGLTSDVPWSSRLVAPSSASN